MTLHLIFNPNMFGEIADWTSLSARKQPPSLCLRFSQYYSRFRFNYNLIVESNYFLVMVQNSFYPSIRLSSFLSGPSNHSAISRYAYTCLSSCWSLFQIENYFLSQTQSMCLLNTKNLENHSTIMFITWSKAKFKANLRNKIALLCLKSTSWCFRTFIIPWNVLFQDYERYDPKAPGLIGVGPLPPAASSHIMPPSVGDDLDSEPGTL